MYKITTIILHHYKNKPKQMIFILNLILMCVIPTFITNLMNFKIVITSKTSLVSFKYVI